jgi:single-stranded-DNA-specific exonuclease
MISSGVLAAPRRLWVMRPAADPAAVAGLAGRLGLPGAVAALLLQRGHGGEAAARSFLRPRLDELHDPFLMAGMAAAAERILSAVRSGETILIHGDYDVDGAAATALLTRVIRALGGRAEPFVPLRMRDGYDFGAAGLREAARLGASLVVTVDCGVSAHETVAAASAAGLDVIVTDHHTPGDRLPAALAVINPSRADCGYPEKTLAGTGVAFRLAQALWSQSGGDAEEVLWHLDLVALATVADLVPLTGGNRTLVRYGLRVLASSRKAGVRALLADAGLKPGEAPTAGQLGHIVAPRINAAGRLGDAGVAVRLLLTEDEAEAASLAQRLEGENRQRQELDRRILDEALELLDEGYDPERDHGVVLAGEGWHPGVIGIVASRVVERIHRPTVLVALEAGAERVRGSARSVPGFDLYAAIAACSEHLERFGGHRQAAGLDIRPERLDSFRAAFNDYAGTALTAEQRVPQLAIDLELPLAEASAELYRVLRHLGPFGVGNPTPVFAARGVELREARVVGSRHLRLRIAENGAELEAIGFGMADRRAELERAGRVDVAFQLHEDEWNGRARLQARLQDVRPS